MVGFSSCAAEEPAHENHPAFTRQLNLATRRAEGVYEPRFLQRLKKEAFPEIFATRAQRRLNLILFVWLLEIINPNSSDMATGPSDLGVVVTVPLCQPHIQPFQ